MRLVQARAELALARGAFDVAIAEGTDSIDQSRAKGRVKYEALGLVTRAQGLHALGRSREAIADARRSVEAARATTDPALLLTALDTMLRIEGDDESAAEARTVSDRILTALPDETAKAVHGVRGRSACAARMILAAPYTVVGESFRDDSPQFWWPANTFVTIACHRANGRGRHGKRAELAVSGGR